MQNKPNALIAAIVILFSFIIGFMLNIWISSQQPKEEPFKWEYKFEIFIDDSILIQDYQGNKHITTLDSLEEYILKDNL